MELPGTILFGENETQSFLCQVIGLDGAAVCWGVWVFFFFLFFCFVFVLFCFNNVYNLPQSLCLL